VVPCHHGMARPQVADGGDGLQIWGVSANILNKQSRTAEMEWPSNLGVGRGYNNSSPQKIRLLRKITRSLRPGQIPWINDLSERKWISDLVLGMSEGFTRNW
jgi:predicted NUDIX family NTP pyrophosphohydrolase